MTIQLTLSTHLEQRLRNEADKRGSSAEACALQLLEQALLPPTDNLSANTAMAEQRLQAATTIQEWVDAANALPEDDDEYDFFAAMNANRAATGERLPYPPELKGVTW